MNNLKRLTRSQSKAKKASKATNNKVPTEPSVNGYNGILHGNIIEVLPFDKTANEENTIKMDSVKMDEKQAKKLTRIIEKKILTKPFYHLTMKQEAYLMIE